MPASALARMVLAAATLGDAGKVTFAGWLRYGLPFTACQLAVSALYVLALFRFMC